MGIIIFAVGGALLASADLFPYETGIAWLKFFGTLCTSLGVAVSGVGIARKVDKGTVVVADHINTLSNEVAASQMGVQLLKQGPCEEKK